MISRRKIADGIIATISESIPAAKVSLRGSILTGQHDELSDIDILVEHTKMRDTDISSLVIESMGAKYQVLFKDWAKGFLPKECVITFFIEGLPLHCFVEVAIIVAEENRHLLPTSISQEYPDHFLKMWTIASKKYSRNMENFELNYLTCSLLNCNVEQVGTPLEALEKTLESIAIDSKNKFPTIYDKCRDYMISIAQGAGCPR